MSIPRIVCLAVLAVSVASATHGIKYHRSENYYHANFASMMGDKLLAPNIGDKNNIVLDLSTMEFSTMEPQISSVASNVLGQTWVTLGEFGQDGIACYDKDLQELAKFQNQTEFGFVPKFVDYSMGGEVMHSQFNLVALGAIGTGNELIESNQALSMKLNVFESELVVSTGPANAGNVGSILVKNGNFTYVEYNPAAPYVMTRMFDIPSSINGPVSPFGNPVLLGASENDFQQWQFSLLELNTFERSVSATSFFIEKKYVRESTLLACNGLFLWIPSKDNTVIRFDENMTPVSAHKFIFSQNGGSLSVQCWKGYNLVLTANNEAAVPQSGELEILIVDTREKFILDESSSSVRVIETEMPSVFQSEFPLKEISQTASGYQWNNFTMEKSEAPVISFKSEPEITQKLVFGDSEDNIMVDGNFLAQQSFKDEEECSKLGILWEYP